MEIQSLKVRITEKDLNDWAGQWLPEDQPIEDLKLRLTPEGVTVAGTYPLFVSVSFETLWEPGVRDGKLTAKLARIKAMGLPMVVFRSVVTKGIADALKGEDWVRVEEETVVLDLDVLLAKQGINARTNLTAVRCGAEELLLEATAPG
jgi:hypothetical protein